MPKGKIRNMLKKVIDMISKDTPPDVMAIIELESQGFKIYPPKEIPENSSA